MSRSWIPIERINEIVQPEPELVVLVLAALSWLFYKIFLRQLSHGRHRSLNRHFVNLLVHATVASLLSGAFWALQDLALSTSLNIDPARVLPYLGFLALLSASVVFIKVCRILTFEFLFLRHMKEGVPLLLVNLITLTLIVLIASWMLTDVFNVRVVPILATSAIFSIVIGLAMQDTLGNLFAGVALQFEKPFTLGDWIEVQTGTQKWIGKVDELSWRATHLLGFFDERITVPNRIIAQAQIANFAADEHPIIRSHLFRFAFDAPLSQIRAALKEAALRVPQVRKDPKPIVLVIETGDSWIGCKLVYFIEDYGSQYLIGDEVISNCLSELERLHIKLAVPKFEAQMHS